MNRKTVMAAAAAVLSVSMMMTAWAGPAEQVQDQGNTPSLLPGVVEGNTYINESLGIKCEFPEEWVLLSEEGKKQINKAAIGVLVDASLNELLYLDEKESYQELFAFSEKDSVNIYITKESKEEKDYLSQHTLKELLESQIPMYQFGLEKVGYEELEKIEVLEEEDFEFPLEDCACIAFTGKIKEDWEDQEDQEEDDALQDMRQVQIYIVREGYDIIITATSIEEDHTMEYLEFFTGIDEEPEPEMPAEQSEAE